MAGAHVTILIQTPFFHELKVIILKRDKSLHHPLHN